MGMDALVAACVFVLKKVQSSFFNGVNYLIFMFQKLLCQNKSKLSAGTLE